jgi:hypothetical protein
VRVGAGLDLPGHERLGRPNDSPARSPTASSSAIASARRSSRRRPGAAARPRAEQEDAHTAAAAASAPSSVTGEHVVGLGVAQLVRDHAAHLCRGASVSSVS